MSQIHLYVSASLLILLLNRKKPHFAHIKDLTPTHNSKNIELKIKLCPEVTLVYCNILLTVMCNITSSFRRPTKNSVAFVSLKDI